MTIYPTFSQLKIPNEIIYSETLVQRLLRIASVTPFVHASLTEAMELKLLRMAKIRAITYSNQIEGNPLKEKDVETLLSRKTKVDNFPEKEIENYSKALDYLEKCAQEKIPLSQRIAMDIHRLVTFETLPREQSGAMRKIPVSIGDSETGRAIETLPDPMFVPQLMEELWQWLANHEQTNAFVLAFCFHFLFVSIHPFVDGNGRTARLLQHYLLLSKGEDVARFVPTETTIMKYRDEYYTSLSQSRMLSRTTPILEFLSKCFAEAAEEITIEAKDLLKESLLKTPVARHRKILAFAKKYNSFGISELVEHLPDIPRRTLERDIEILVKSRSLKSKGQGRARKYLFNL